MKSILNPFTILAAVNPLGGNEGRLEGFGVYEPKNIPGSGDPGANVVTLIFTNVFSIMTIVAGLLFIIYFLTGALSWITSSGNQEKLQKARDKMTNAVIGLIAVVAAYGIAFIIGKILGITILNPSCYIYSLWLPNAGGGPIICR